MGMGPGPYVTRAERKVDNSALSMAGWNFRRLERRLASFAENLVGEQLHAGFIE